MAWIKVEQSLPAHRKTLVGSELAGMDRYKYIGHLIKFWTWALDHADDDGKLPGLTDDMFGEMAGLSKGKQSRAFISSLKETSFIDVRGDRCYLHDWKQYAGRLLERRAKDAARKAEERRTGDGHD